MARLDESGTGIVLKIVFWGPPSSGKTTNFRFIQKKLSPNQRSPISTEVIGSVEALFFRFTPVNIGEAHGKKVMFDLIDCPGEMQNPKSADKLLKAVDGVFFVADSSPSAMDGNLSAMKTLSDALARSGVGKEDISLTLQFNKRDISDAALVEEMKAALDADGTPSFEATAENGKGVLECFTNLSRLMLRQLKSRPLPTREEAEKEETMHEELPESPPPLTEESKPTAPFGGEASVPEIKKSFSDSLSRYAFDEDEVLPPKEGGVEEMPVQEEGFRDEAGGFSEETVTKLGHEPEITDPFRESEIRDAFDTGIEEAGSPVEAIDIPEPEDEPFDSGGEEMNEKPFLATALPEGIEMEPGFEMEDEGEPFTHRDEEPDDESFETAGLPEGIVMEPGFEVGETDLDTDAIEFDADSYDDTLTAYAEEAAESLDEVDLPEGIEMEPGFEVGNEEIEAMEAGDEPSDAESFNETLTAYAEEMADAPGAIDVPEDIPPGDTFELEEGGLTPPVRTHRKEPFAASRRSLDIETTVEAASECRLSLGIPKVLPDGSLSIPIVLCTGEKEKTFRLNLSLTPSPGASAQAVLSEPEEDERADTEALSAPEETVDETPAPLPFAPVEPESETAFLDELGDDFSSGEAPASAETWETGVTDTVVTKKRGFFSRLFGRKG